MFGRARNDVRLMSDLFTRAESLAAELGDTQAGSEHLMIAALERGGPFRGIDADAFKATVRDGHRAIVGVDPLPVPEPTGPMRLSGQARDAFQRARREAKAHRAPLDEQLVIRHLVEDDQGTVARSIAALGRSRDELLA